MIEGGQWAAGGLLDCTDNTWDSSFSCWWFGLRILRMRMGAQVRTAEMCCVLLYAGFMSRGITTRGKVDSAHRTERLRGPTTKYLAMVRKKAG